MYKQLQVWLLWWVQSFRNKSAQTTKLGRCWKRHFCLCHRSDYSPSFQHKFKDNNHGFVFWRHARPLRPENAGENQNQREGKLELQVPLSCIPPANTDTEDRVVFLLISAVTPAIFSSFCAFVHMVCFLCFVIELVDLHQSCFFWVESMYRGDLAGLLNCRPLNSISPCIIEEQQLLLCQLELNVVLLMRCPEETHRWGLCCTQIIGVEMFPLFHLIIQTCF